MISEIHFIFPVGSIEYVWNTKDRKCKSSTKENESGEEERRWSYERDRQTKQDSHTCESF